LIGELVAENTRSKQASSAIALLILKWTSWLLSTKIKMDENFDVSTIPVHQTQNEMEHRVFKILK
jgi:hypothetical protein